MKKLFIKQKQFLRPSSARNFKPKLPEDDRTLPVEALDRVSCFETMRVYKGVVFHGREHLERLADSCQGIGRSLPADPETLQAWLRESLRNSGLKNALLRLTAHWFDERNPEGRFVLYLREFKSYPSVWYEKGVELKTATRRRWGFNAQDPQIKASQFMNGVLAILDESGPKAPASRLPAGEAGSGWHELIFFGPRGTVAEGSVSNLFIVKQKRLLTPSVSSGILRGVTRSVVIGLANKRGIEVVETLLTRHEFYTAEECFMTNTSSEILPVASIDGRKIGRGIPGPITCMLAKDFQRKVILNTKQEIRSTKQIQNSKSQ